MMLVVYEILVTLAMLAAFPALIVNPRWRRRLTDRIGLWSPLVYERLAGRPVIWAHCSSVGEVLAARPLIERLLDENPKHAFLITTMTTTGLDTAEGIFGKRAAVCLIPVDSYFCLRHVFRRVKPAVLLVFETELWPRLLHMAKASGARILLVNGRISARSFKRYRLIRFVLRDVLANFERFLMSGPDSAARIIDLGAPADRVRDLGNVKWASIKQAGVYPSLTGWPEATPILLAGSTHPGEEEQVLDIYEDARQYQPGLKLILAPRHPKRVEDVERLLRSRGMVFRKRSAPVNAAVAKDAEVFLLDTVGELAMFFPLATVAFLGGSLVPIGGHNMLEPAAAGIPVLYGPHTQNFADVAAALESQGAAMRGADWKVLAKLTRDLLSDPVRRARMGTAGKAAVAGNAKILDRYMAEIREYL
jgi:3-deoxy-D-manno-octulosonic-acid transferase